MTEKTQIQLDLDTKLTDAADRGDVAATIELLERGADTNGRHCLAGCRYTPLMKAAASGHIKVIEILMENGANAELLDKSNRTAGDIALANGKPEIMALIKEYEQKKSPDKITFYDRIGNRTRADIYDFRMRERITLIRQSKYGLVETTTITGFSAIEDQSDDSMLRRAFNEHMRRGGKSEESAVFTNRLPKARIPPRKN